MNDEGAFRYCRWSTSRSGSHFPVSFRVLPEPERRAMEAVYAYCRVVDDVVDTPSPRPSPQRGEGELRKEELLRWRQEIRRIEEGVPVHPIAVALKPVVERYQIPVAYLEKLIDGVEMDLSRTRYATFEELKRYCEHVASVVGLISVRVFGCRRPETDRYARALGIALQMTNILRDLKEDAARGRVYLPKEDLARFGVRATDLTQGALTEPMGRLIAFECERARGYFQEAGQVLLTGGERRKLLPARVMGAVYRRILERIETDPGALFSSRVRVSRREQVWIALKCLIRGAS